MNYPLRKNLLNIVVMLIIIAGILWTYSITYFTVRLYESLTTTELKFPSILLGDGSTGTLADALPDLEQEIDRYGSVFPVLEREVEALYWLARPIVLVMRIVSVMPVVGPYAEQVDPLFNYARHVTQAGTLSIPTMDALIEIAQMDLPMADMIQQIQVTLLDNQGTIMLASLQMEKAKLARKAIDISLLPDGIANPIARVDEHFDKAYGFLELLVILPNALGSPEEGRTYLLLAQNKDELRATGGFISGIGWLQIEAGRVTDFHIGDSYDVDNFTQQYPPPPTPLKQFMLADYWLPRDANWSPDFATSARLAQELITLSTGRSSDGVIAFDQEAVRIIVEALGTINAVTFPEPIRSNNVEMVMQQAWASSPPENLTREWWEQRKDFMSHLGTAILGKVLYSSDKELLFNLSDKLFDAVKAGHVLVYINNDEIQAALEKTELDNSVHPGEGDFLLLVDSNLGFNKVDAVIERQVTYTIDLSNPDDPRATLVIEYLHTIEEEIPCIHEASYGTGSYADMQKRCYWNYWRVYKTAGTQLLAANKTPVPGLWLLSNQDWDGNATIETSNHDTEVISGFFVLGTNQSQNVSMQFVLPPSVLVHTTKDVFLYQLTLQKQAGLEYLPVVLQVIPPPNFHLMDADGAWQFDQNSGLWSWSSNMTSSQNFELRFSQDT